MLKELIQRISGQQESPEETSVDIRLLEKKIGCSFGNKDLLLHALKHRSYLNQTGEAEINSNERLEFLGDAVLDLIVTEFLYSKYPAENEGSLSKKKSVLVSRQALAHIVNDLELGHFLLVNKGEEKTGGRERLSNLANLFEALLGAIYLDRGYEQAVRFVRQFLLDMEDVILNKTTYFNYKSSLLEYSQARGWGSPIYSIIEETGPDHAKQFVISVKVGQKLKGRGAGKSKKNAEQLAARDVWERINSEPKT